MGRQATRLHPKHGAASPPRNATVDKTVKGCRDCPMAFFEWCQHPNKPDRKIADLSAVAPSWCPLRAEPLTIRLAVVGKDGAR